MLFEELEQRLKHVKFISNGNTRGARMPPNTKKSLIMHFGYTHHKFTGRWMMSAGSRDHPEIHELLEKIALEHFPDLKYNHIQINKNLLTVRHRDRNNRGESATFCVGSYTGGGLGVDGLVEPVDTYKRPYIMDGSKVFHWTTPFEGTRFCVIYYNIPQKCSP
jgi:hypothetical protein